MDACVICRWIVKVVSVKPDSLRWYPNEDKAIGCTGVHYTVRFGLLLNTNIAGSGTGWNRHVLLGEKWAEVDETQGSSFPYPYLAVLPRCRAAIVCLLEA